MKSRLLIAGALIALAVVAFEWSSRWRDSLRDGDSFASTTPPGDALPHRAAVSPPQPPPLSEPLPPATKPPLESAIDRLLALLERGAATAEDFAALKAELLGAAPAQSIAAIRAFLRSGRNAVTRQDFAIGSGGALASAPTMRVFLLDLLGQVARRSRSPAAAEVSREILAEKTSADEWALALRNLAWTEPQARTYLGGKVREMLAFAPWRASPSAGMLEALDVVVFTRDASLIPDLDEARTAGGELAHATDIALDRLADAAPLDVLTWLNTHPRTLDDRPFLRADYFAKADLSQGAQRAQIEIYLTRPDIAAAEKTKLLKALTAPASFVSETLLSTPPPADDGAPRRAALGRAVTDWLSTDRFPLLRETLLETQAALAP